MSSNWIAAAPNALGEARRNKAWFSPKVKNREKSWRAIREDAEDMEELSGQVAESAELVIVLEGESCEGTEDVRNTPGRRHSLGHKHT